jgi:hypothetical protein
MLFCGAIEAEGDTEAEGDDVDAARVIALAEARQAGRRQALRHQRIDPSLRPGTTTPKRG